MSREHGFIHLFVVSLKVIILTVVMFVLFSTIYTAVGVGSDPSFGAEAGSTAAAAPVEPGRELPSPVDQGRLAMILVGVCFLQTVGLSVAILRSRWSGWKLVLAMFIVMAGGTAVLSHIDSLFFLRNLSRIEIGKMALASTLIAAAFSAIAVWVLGRARQGATEPSPTQLEHHSKGQWALILLGLAALHVVLYFLFGYYVAWQSPELRAFYGGEDPGSFWLQMASVATGSPWLIPVQILRGVLWGLLAVILARSLTGSAWSAGLITAALFVVLFCLPLVFPNPFMPDAVRQAHLIETIFSRSLYGFLAVWLLRTPWLLGHAHPRPA